MTAEPLLVSAIIPAYNAAGFLAEAVESVRRQAHRPMEIVVVDDGSTDGTAALAAELGGDVRLVRRPNGGPSAARNSGLESTRGEVIAFLDADDLWTDDKLALQLPRLEAHPEVEIVMGKRQYLRLAERAGGRHVYELLDDLSAVLNLNCALIRRRLFERVGLLDESLRLCEDWDWFMRCREQNVPMLLHDDVVLLQRVHEGNITRDRQGTRSHTIAMLKKSLDRRRNSPDGRRESLPPLASFREEPPREEG